MAIRGRSFPQKAANIGLAPVAAGSGSATGTVAQTLPKVGQAAAGTNEPEYTGTIAQTLPHVTQSAAQYRYISGISGNGRYFVDQSGSPILIKGYFAWSGIADWSSSQADTYLDHVKAQGGNTILMECVAVDGDGGGPNASGATYDSVAPFVGGDVTVFNSTYWARMDSYLAKARARGLSVVLYPMDGWNTGTGKAFDGATTGECQTYGQTLATRYLSHPGILWGFGGDYTPDGGTVDAQFNACLTGIRAAGDSRPATIQLDYYKSLSTDSSYWESRVQYNFVYTYYVQYKGVLDGYRRTPGARDPRPSMWMEGRYEGEGGGPGEPTVIPEVFRKQELWSLTSGSPGVFYGSADWNFPSGWEGRLGTTTEDQLQKAREWFAGLPWHTLEPDDVTAVVTAGRGTKITTDSATWPGSNDYVTAARSADGLTVVAYVPSNSGNTARTITLDPARLPTTNRVSLWVDPTDATSTQTATINGSNQTTTPGTHGDGTRDWLLLITGDAPTSTGTVAQTLPHVTQAASGTNEPEYVGAIAQTLPRVTQAATGTAEAEYTGSAAQTLPRLTQSGAGTFTAPTFTGTAAQTLPKVAQSASGTAEAEYEGVIAQTLPRVTQAASGTSEAEYEGAIAQTLPRVTQSVAGTNEPEYVGTAAQTLGRVVQAASGTFTLPAGSGTMAQTLPRVTQSATGTAEAEFTGVVIQTLPHITQSGSGTFVSANRTGAIVQTLGKVGQAAAGEVDNPPGNVGIIGQTLPHIGQAASGTNEPEYTGSVAQSLPSLTQSVTGTVTLLTVSGSISQQLPKLSQVASGTFRSFSTGVISQTLPHVTQYAQETPVVEIPYTFTKIAVTSGPRGSGISAKLRNS